MIILDEVVKTVKEHQGTETAIDVDVSLVDLGINSFSFIQIAVAMEDKYQIKFEDEYLDYTAFNNIREVAAYVENKVNLGHA